MPTEPPRYAGQMASTPPPPATHPRRLRGAPDRARRDGGDPGCRRRAAGVSKGGLLYHFGIEGRRSIDGLLARLSDTRSPTDIADIRSAPAGAVDYLIRTSVSAGTPLDRTIVAVTRLAQGSHPPANDMLAGFRRSWSP